MTLRLLSSGVDSLYLSVAGGLGPEVLGALATARVRAQHGREAVPFAFERFNSFQPSSRSLRGSTALQLGQKWSFPYRSHLWEVAIGVCGTEIRM